MRVKTVKKFLATLTAVILMVVIVAPVLASTAMATRILPASVESGVDFDVGIEASGCGAFGQVVETLPDGFTYLGCTPGYIGVEEVGNTVKFTFLGSESFTYRVKAPTVVTTTIYTFRGIVNDDNKNEYPIIEDNDITVTASGPVTYALRMAVEVDESGSTIPSVGKHVYDAGEVVHIRATPDSGWRFDHWSSKVADPGSSSTKVTMDSDKRVTAYFIQIPTSIYTLTVTCQISEGGSVILTPTTENNQYEEDSLVELTAIPSDGYAFSSWSGDLAGSNNPENVTMDSDKNITADFVLLEQKEPASFEVSPLSISPEQVQPNQPVRISINITNNGREVGNYDVALYINGQIEDSQTVSVSSGSARTVVFNATKATQGTYTISLGGQQGQFTVVGSQSVSGGLDIGTTIAIVGIVLLVTAIVFVFRMIIKRA
ncbi:MAG TPA: hypothetical protein G4N93_00140 [Dehalococcoidia bacterium]|nr:hypothetical protein [Dehalococcoidia bacterium]